MDFFEYQAFAESTRQYPNVGNNLIYPSLKLCGESGEVAEKVGKLWRNEGATAGSHLFAGDKEAIVKELGDVLWYISALASELGVSLEAVAVKNVIKLQDRKNRNVIKSEGDDR